ncbi:hypothetical protein EMIT043CA1_190070 [Pseudomonas brassicacearum]
MCGHATEADFGELRYLDAARLKAGAHYTGIRPKRELFLLPDTVMGLAVTGPGVNGTTVCFAEAQRCGDEVLKRFIFTCGSKACSRCGHRDLRRY